MISGIGSAISGLVSGIGKGLSAIGGLFTKARESGPERGQTAQQIQNQLGAGQPLESTVKSRMGSALGYDFSRVRVHVDSNAGELSNRLNARAFTIGQDVGFATGEYTPGTVAGDALIAHELAHVVQQERHTSSITPPRDQGVRYDALEEDADNSAAAAVSSLWGRGRVALAGLGRSVLPNLRSGLKLQRCGKNACPDQWQKKLDRAVEQAKVWVDNAASKVDSVLAAPNHVDPAIAQQLRHHFKVKVSDVDGMKQIDPSSLQIVKEVREALASVQAGFGGSVPFECDPDQTGSPKATAAGEVKGLPFGLTRIVSSVHLYQPWFDQTDDTKAALTIVHEMFHKYAGKSDEAKGHLIYYCDDFNTYSALGPEDHLALADSFAMLIYYLQGTGKAYCNAPTDEP